MTTQEIANRLVELCSQGNWEQAQQELYHQEASSIEPEGVPGGSVTGMEAIKVKGEQWQQSVEAVHSSDISEPLVAGNFFSVRMSSDITMKGIGRMAFDELCVYEVKDGKIIKEQFFYAQG